jgi:hypothetical protein
MADADMAAAALFGVLGLITPLSDFSIASGVPVSAAPLSSAPPQEARRLLR